MFAVGLSEAASHNTRPVCLCVAFCHVERLVSATPLLKGPLMQQAMVQDLYACVLLSAMFSVLCLPYLCCRTL